MALASAVAGIVELAVAVALTEAAAAVVTVVVAMAVVAMTVAVAVAVAVSFGHCSNCMVTLDHQFISPIPWRWSPNC